ncbi:transposase [Streptomyces sp. NPDC056470]|uniref:transposase n=1 Tax=Streptomyces sp. NPDC056470 TaxID=3345831 RepID=UPI00369BE4D1
MAFADLVRACGYAVESILTAPNRAGERVLAPEGLYGRRKMLALIRRTLLPEAGFGAVDRAMGSLGLNGVARGRKPRTTIPNAADQRAPDLLGRDFTAPAPNRKWITDFTAVRTYQSFTYVAFIIDCFSQNLVSWHASVQRDVELVDVPLRMALWRRGHEGTPIRRGQLAHHSDAGSQYTSVRFTEHLEIEGIRPSIGSVGDAYDNALMETINGLYEDRFDGIPAGPHQIGERHDQRFRGSSSPAKKIVADFRTSLISRSRLFPARSLRSSSRSMLVTPRGCVPHVVDLALDAPMSAHRLGQARGLRP